MLTWEPGVLEQCGSFSLFHLQVPHGGAMPTLLWWDGLVQRVPRASHARWEGCGARCWGPACQSSRAVPGVRVGTQGSMGG